MDAKELLARYAAGERDFPEADLRVDDFRGADLRSADLRLANLVRANFTGANLAYADLSGANLDGADLSSTLYCARLVGANLRGAKFRGANLGNASLSEANLRGADLRGANLSGADLRKATLFEALLLESNLGGVDLRYVDLRYADLRGLDLGGSDLSGAYLDETDFREADLNESKLCGACLYGADLNESNLSGADLSGAYLNGAYLRDANLNGADLSQSELFEVDLSGANLSDANLSGANLYKANLNGANLIGATFDDVQLGLTSLQNLDLGPVCNAVVRHVCPSFVDWISVAKSLRAPRLKEFLAATGIPALVVSELVKCARSLDLEDDFSMMQSTFISYGGPDEPFARKLHEALQRNGVTTFFFAEHAVPGKKLHRLMRDGVNSHDRVILICSKASLGRKGVLNEIEETLARESRDGGAEYLIPVRIDDYLFDGWNPADPGVAQTIKDRVVADFRGTEVDDAKFGSQLMRLLGALKKKP